MNNVPESFQPASSSSATGFSCTRKYLLLRSAHGHWEFPKGHLKSGETWQQAAMRELAEEAGITDAIAIPGFARQIQYFFSDRRRGLVDKIVAFLVAETKQMSATPER